MIVSRTYLLKMWKSHVQQGYPTDKRRYVAGQVKNRLPVTEIERIVLLRIGMDRHERKCNTPTQTRSIGGVILIDDYGTFTVAAASCRRISSGKRNSAIPNATRRRFVYGCQAIGYKWVVR